MDKTPIIMQQVPNTTIKGRFIVYLASAVALLAVAFIVLIACGTWLVQQKQSCDTTKPSRDSTNTMEYDIEIPTNNSEESMHEHVTILADEQLELAVARDPKTGLIAYVLVVDYAKELMAVYFATVNKCFFNVGMGPNLEKEIEFLQNYKKNDPLSQSFLRETAPLANASIIPDQLTAFCSIANSHWTEPGDEPSSETESRVKRQAVYNCYYILYSCYVYNGYVYCYSSYEYCSNYYYPYCNCPYQCYYYHSYSYYDYYCYCSAVYCW